MPQRTKTKHSAQKTRKLIALFSRISCVLLFVVFSNAERLPVKTYTTADGLPRDSVSRIRRDSRGFLWFCTNEGISRFDGTEMMNFTASDGLPSRFVSDFLETQNGTIYIATGKGLARLNARGMRDSQENPLFSVFLPENPKSEKIQILYQDRSNRIWVGTSDGLYKLIETDGQIKFENVLLGAPLSSSGGAIAAPSPNTLSVNAILETADGTFWIGTYGGGLFRIAPNANVRRYTNDGQLRDNKITDLLETADGRIWMSLRSDEKGGICLLDAANTENPVIKCYTVENGLGSNWIRDMFQTSDGQMWLATVPGLCRFQPENPGNVCKTFSNENDLCDDVFALAEDTDGNLWTGASCGVKKIARYGFTTYNRADGLDSDQITSIFENRAGELFAATFPQKKRVINRFDSEKFVSVNPRLPEYVDYHGWGWQQTVLQDSRGAWWIPTGRGLFRSADNTNFENLAAAALEKQATGAKGNEVFRLFEDSRGDVWMATIGDSNELFRWERAANVWHDHTREVGFSFLRVGSAFAEDAHGNVWIGATSDHGDSALIRYRRGEFTVLSKDSGFRNSDLELKSGQTVNSKSSGVPSNWIQDLFIDSRGRLWIASDNEGLWRLDETNADKFDFIKYTPANGLTSNATASVTEDEFGRIYVGTWRGIDRLNPKTGQIENFTTADGLPAGFVESSFRDRRNNLWFTTGKGLVRFVPEPPRVRKPPNILINGLRLGGEAQNISILGESEIPPLNLSSDQRQITIDFIGLGTSLGEKLNYEYRFGGADWTKTDERTLHFANLAAGDYRLEVRAQTADRLYSQPATASFRIAAPVWQRWWFLLAAVLAITFFIYLIYKYRLRKLLELEKIRTRIATDLHDDIGANLTRISLLSEVAKQKSTNGNGEMLTSIASIARESVASMNDIVWAIAPEHDSLLDLTKRMRLFAEEIFALRDVDLEFNAAATDTKLSVGVRRDLLLIFKEAVNNAAKHSNCSRVTIDFEFAAATLRLRIKDDGTGFDSSATGDGQGLRSMTRRAAALGGVLKIESSGGTIVDFTLALSKAATV